MAFDDTASFSTQFATCSLLDTCEISPTHHILEVKEKLKKLTSTSHFINNETSDTPTPNATPNHSISTSPLYSVSSEPDQEVLQANDPAFDVNESATSEEEVDPRIQVELEAMNKACDDVNLYESNLNKNQDLQIKSLREAGILLSEMKIKVSEKIVLSAKSFYDISIKAKQVHILLCRASSDYEIMKKERNIAREVVTQLETELMKCKLYQNNLTNMSHHTHPHNLAMEKLNLSNELLELLNNELKRKQAIHRDRLLDFNQLHEKLTELKAKNFKNIAKARPFYDLKRKLDERQQELVTRQKSILRDIKQSKVRYSVAMKNLEAISLQIHNQRGTTILAQKIKQKHSSFILLDGSESLDIDDYNNYNTPITTTTNKINTSSLIHIPSFDDLHSIDGFEDEIIIEKASSLTCIPSHSIDIEKLNVL